MPPQQPIEQPTKQPTDRPVALVTEPIADAPRAYLAEHTELLDASPSDPDFQTHLARAHALVVRTATRVDAAMLDNAPNLRVVARAGVGLDTIDLAACAQCGITVVHTPGANADAVAEYVLSMLLRALRHHDTNPPKDWEAARAAAVSRRSISTETLGILGLGAVGSRVAFAARALGARVLYHDIADIPETKRAGATPVDMPTLLAESTALSIHVDDRPQNRHLINASTLATLSSDAVLLNTSRGFVINEPDLAAFARNNPAAQIILDVHQREPYDPNDALGQYTNVTRTPHIASATAAAKEAMSWVVRDAVAVLQGRKPEHPAPNFRP